MSKHVYKVEVHYGMKTLVTVLAHSPEEAAEIVQKDEYILNDEYDQEFVVGSIHIEVDNIKLVA